MNDLFVIIGEVEERVDGVLVNKRRNNISSDMKNFFRNMLGSSTNVGINNNLFTEDNIRPGGSMDGQGGIVIVDGELGGFTRSNSTVTLITEVETAVNYGYRWHGSITASQEREVHGLYLGGVYTTHSSGQDAFQNMFAFIFKTTEERIRLSQSQLYEVTWTIRTP